MFTQCLQNERHIIFCNVTNKVRRDLNNKTKQFSDTWSVHRQLSCTYLIVEWSFTYQSCDHRSLWLVIPDYLQCLLAHDGSVNNKCFTKSIKKLSMNESVRLIVYEVCFTLASSTQQYFSFVYFSVVSSVQRFLNVQKSLGGNTKKFCNFTVIEGNQMPLGSFMYIWTGNKCVKFQVKIPSGCLENGKQL